jgi:hypothetical protein
VDVLAVTGLRFGQWWDPVSILAKAPSSALGPTHHRIQSFPVAFSPGEGRGERLGREADHSSSSHAEVKNERSSATTPLYPFVSACTLRGSLQ